MAIPKKTMAADERGGTRISIIRVPPRSSAVQCFLWVGDGCDTLAKQRDENETTDSCNCDCGFGRIDDAGAGEEGRDSASGDEGGDRHVGRAGGHHRGEARSGVDRNNGGGRRGQQTAAWQGDHGGGRNRGLLVLHPTGKAWRKASRVWAEMRQ